MSTGIVQLAALRLKCGVELLVISVRYIDGTMASAKSSKKESILKFHNKPYMLCIHILNGSIHAYKKEREEEPTTVVEEEKVSILNHSFLVV